MGRMRMTAVAVMLAAALGSGLARPATAAADDAYVNDFGLGVGAVFVNLVYMPVKVVYATLGGITGGFAYVLTGGRMDTARAVWTPSLGGTYVVTPTMLRGEQPIYFSGVNQPRERAVTPRDTYEEDLSRSRRAPADGY